MATKSVKHQQKLSTSKVTSEHMNCADYSLVFMCNLPTKEGPQAAREQEAVVVKLPAHCTVEQLRLVLCMRVQETRKFQDTFGLLDPLKYSLVYTKDEDQYEIYDDCQVLKTLNAPWFQNNEGYQTVKITVLARQEDKPKKRTEYQHILNELIGFDIDCEAGNRLSELSFTRRKFATPRMEELKHRDPVAYATEPWTTSAPIPKDQEDQLKRKLLIIINYDNMSVHVKADLLNTPSDLLKVLWQSLQPSKDQCFLKWSANYVLKVCRREEFLHGDFHLSDFLWVRHCLKNVKELHLNVVAIASLPDDAVRKEHWPQVDSFTGLSSSHEEISLVEKEMEEIVMISLWDCERNLRVKLLGFDIPELPSKIPQHVYVEASIIYGSKVVYSVCSSSKEFAEEVLWNTWLEFNIFLKDIPRGAKLGFTVNASSIDTTPTRESKSYSAGNKVPDYQKGKGKVLYFVNLQLIDHRSLLSQGSHTLHMWSFPEQEEAFTYDADKLSTATNPDVAKSMAITFLLDRYSFSVVVPNSQITPSTAILPSSNPSSPLPVTGSSQSLPGHLTLQTNTLDKPCHKMFREESVRYASNLPQFLRTVNWLKPSAVQDVHWLLCHWKPDDLELPVALELLSVDYTDEKVRRLAVQRLEMMSNEEVLRYLLQLVQVRRHVEHKSQSEVLQSLFQDQ